MEGWIDEEDKAPLSAAELMELRVKALESHQREQDERLRRLEAMHYCKDHIAYHEALTEEARQWWYDQGMMPSTIDEYILGYCADCPTAPGRASYTIPVWDFDGHLINIRHRLANPINGDKYRPHRSGLGAAVWGAHLLKNARGKRVVVVEGEKKAIVLNQFGFLAVGLMGQHTFKREWLPWFDGVGSIVVALDPDAKESAQRLGEIFAKSVSEVRIANFCVKPDDAITRYGATLDDIEATLRLGKLISNVPSAQRQQY